MPFKFTVFWPKTAVPQIPEIRFSFEFCRKMTRAFAQKLSSSVFWFDYSDHTRLDQVLSRIHGPAVILIRNPEVIVSPQALQALCHTLDSGQTPCAPVYNDTPVAPQRAILPTPYLDMDTFLELSEMLSREPSCFQSHHFEDACVCVDSEFLKTLPASTPLPKIVPAAVKKNQGVMTLVRHALAHLGFQPAFQTERHDLVQLVPNHVFRVLDVGCAMGGYGRALKAARPDILITGVEMNRAMAAHATPLYDEIVTRPIEEIDFDQPFDLINCGDILEHLADPWELLGQFHNALAENGHIVLSVPNVGHWSVVRGLMKGRFQYTPLGLLCVGHLRWFTESSLREALAGARFRIEIFERQQAQPTPEGERFIDRMVQFGYGDAQSLQTNEFIIRAAKIS